jgi:hypothetical protein
MNWKNKWHILFQFIILIRLINTILLLSFVGQTCHWYNIEKDFLNKLKD